MSKITIAVAGHTNAGKTSIISTLTRSNVGDIDDRANVTTEGKTIYFDFLLANFIDCPGFQQASRILEFYEDEYDKNNEYPTFNVVENAFQKRYQKFQYDLEAIKALTTSDIVIYVGNLETVPDDSFKDEISLTKCIQPKSIAVLNKYIKECRGTSVETVTSRIKQWESIFQENHIEFIVFDAFWDSPRKVEKIYTMIENILEGDKRKEFLQGKTYFKDQQDEIRRLSCETLFNCIQQIYNNCLNDNSVEKKQFNNPEYKKQFKTKLENQIATSTRDFLFTVSTRYKVASDFPTTSIGDIELKVQDIVPDLEKRAIHQVQVSNNMSGLVGLLGGVLGLAIASYTGNMKASDGFVRGSTYGRHLGSLLANLFPYSGEEDLVNFVIDNTIITETVVTYLAILWGFSQIGFARRYRKLPSQKDLSISEIDYLKKLIKNENKDSFDILNWKNTTHKEFLEITAKFEKILNSLEIKENIYDLNLEWVK